MKCETCKYAEMMTPDTKRVKKTVTQRKRQFPKFWIVDEVQVTKILPPLSVFESDPELFNSRYRTCMRFPQSLRVNLVHRCGEYKEKDQ